MPLRFRFALALLVLVSPLFGPTVSGQEKAKKELFVWEISSKKNKIYVAGSVHLGFAGLYPLPKEIEKAFAESDKLAVEVNVDNVNATELLQMIRKGTYKGEKKLSTELPEKILKQLKDYCKKNNIPFRILDRYRPWMASILLTDIMAKKAGFDLNKGLEKHFLKKARKRGMPVLELESMKIQMNMFIGFDKEFQERMLLDALSDAKSFKESIGAIFAAWKSGDLAKMHKIAILDPQKAEPKLKGLYVKMFDERNIKMAKKVEGYLQGKDRVFVLVGSGHLPGQKGILKLLQDKGYKIRQLTQAK